MQQKQLTYKDKTRGIVVCHMDIYDVTTVRTCLEITDMYHSLALSVSNNY